LAARHFRFVRRLDLERCGAVKNGVGVDAGNGGDIVRRGRANDDLLHRKTKLPEKKSPRNTLEKKTPRMCTGAFDSS